MRGGRLGWTTLLALLVASTACGTRVPHEEALAVAQGEARPSSGAGTGGATGPATPSADPGVAPTSDPAAAVGLPGDPGSASGGDAAAVNGGAPAAAGDSATATGSGAEIRIGMIGNFTGVVGASFAPARDAFQAWVSMVNGRGGINGHPVRLFVADDGNDSAQDVAIARDFVENRGVIALVNVFPAGGGTEAVADYAEERGIPVVGGATYDQAFYESPMLFPQTTGFENTFYGTAAAARDSGSQKVAIVYCTEGAVCRRNAEAFERHAVEQGLEVVYRAAVSLAQPDYTAECVNARSAGADVFVPYVDGNSVSRLARSCDRQGYEPTYIVPAPVDPPVGELEGAFAAVPSFPWFLETGSPAIEEYAAAMEQHAPGTARNSFTTQGWLSGKLFERAAAGVSGTPTSEQILEGLWALQGETLGGLAPPLTFVRGQPAPEANCSFIIEVQDGRWTAPRGVELTGCRP